MGVYRAYSPIRLSLRIHRLSLDEQLEVQMRSGHAARAARLPDYLSRLHEIADTNVLFRQMGIPSLPSVGMSNPDQISVVTVLARKDHSTLGGSPHVQTVCQTDIHSFVEAGGAGYRILSPTKCARDRARQR
jgi:hypothetical protein